MSSTQPAENVFVFCALCAKQNKKTRIVFMECELHKLNESKNFICDDCYMEHVEPDNNWLH